MKREDVTERFVDRESELATLRERFESDHAEFLVVYGRRRVGKSALVREAVSERDDAVYWQATEETADVQLESFLTRGAETFPELADTRRDWEAVLRTLGRRDAVVVVDEFPYLIESDDAVPSKFQRVWDTTLEETATTLVLIGSSISVMEDTVLGRGSPLYGRRTGVIDLGPLSLSDATTFYPGDDADTAVRAWSVFGGTPYYLRALSPEETLPENVRRHVLAEHGVLHDEPEFLLRTEFGIREPRTYYTILRAIASGRRAANEIATFAGVDTNGLGSYLSKLRRLRLVERDLPVTADPNSRRSRYRLREPLFRFWFEYVYGNETTLTQLGTAAFEEHVAPTFADYVAPAFERLCQDALPRLVPKTYHDIGYWWYDRHELDVVGLATDGTLVVGECKYTTRPMNEGDLADLERTADHVRWTPTDGSDPDRHYCCFSRSGFSDGLRSRASERTDLSLFEPPDLLVDP